MSRRPRPVLRAAVLDGLERKENGVTVVLASYRPPESVTSTLESLARQTLDPSRYEVILAVNGPQSEDVSAYEAFATEHPDLRLRVLRTPVASVSHALNLGLQAARMSWTTFVDDDDHVSPRYLEGLLAAARPGLLPVTVIHDVTPDGTVSTDNRITRNLGPLQGSIVSPHDGKAALSFSVCKLIPTDWARTIRHDPQLISGHDIAFYASLYARYDFDLVVVPADLESVYYRNLTEESVSRRELTFDFAVEERLAVITSLSRLLDRVRPPKRRLIRSFMRAQTTFIRRYLDTCPGDRSTVIAMIRSRGIAGFPWDILTKDAARRLVVSVCFPPFSDASSVTVAKRILEAGEVVDVVSADMSEVRRTDPTLQEIVEGLVDEHTILRSRMTFSDWQSARNFTVEGWEALTASSGFNWPYSSLYSRAMWPASHVLASYIKFRRPSTYWTAEFSDPLSRTIQGAPRPGSFEEDELVSELMSASTDALAISLPAPSTVFELAELVPFALADELVFTNQHQMDYMLESWGSEDLTRAVIAKARISPHPTLPFEFYRMTNEEPAFGTDYVRIAYFGSFYANRSLGDVFTAIAALPLDRRRRLRFDIYTNERSSLLVAIAESNLLDIVAVHDPVPYLDFLKLTTHYDCLLVNDTDTAGSHKVNPYLPSKWSDYLGSGTAIWSVVEPGSSLSALPTDYSSRSGDLAEAILVLNRIIEDRLQDPLRNPAAVGARR